MSAPKRLAVVAYYFEPQTSVGVFRTVRLVKHLLSQGWMVDVVTVVNPDPQFEPVRDVLPSDLVHHDNLQIHSVRALPVKKLWQWPTAVASKLNQVMGRSFDGGRFAGRFWHIDMQWGFARAAKAKLHQLLQANIYDAVYVSCPPFSSAEPAVQGAAAHDVPIVLDFRDSWVPSPYATASTRAYDGVERGLLNEASALIVNTKADVALYNARIDQSKLHWLPNGFDAPMQGPFPYAKTSMLRLAYLGAWDDGPRDPRPLLRALKQVSWPWHLSNYANDHGALQRAAADVGVEDHISCHGFVPKSQIGEIIAASDALVLVQGHGADKSAPVTHVAAKTFDYLATGRMILGLVADGANKDILLQHAAHATLAAPDDGAQISDALAKLHEGWNNNALPTQPDTAFLDVYSEQALGQKFEAICAETMARRSAK